jgi:GST-like protein
MVIDLYYWTTPNGHKITIFLEESGLEYHIKPVNIGNNEQFAPSFLTISPNNKMPAIVDKKPNDGGQPISVFESGAILLYLADKTKKFISQDIRTRTKMLEWLFWQMAGLGPMSGQNSHFVKHAPVKVPYALDRYIKETTRLYGVLDKQLSDKPYIVGEYSIVDMACYPWVVPYEMLSQNLEVFPNIKRWFLQMQARPAVRRAYEIASEINPQQ